MVIHDRHLDDIECFEADPDYQKVIKWSEPGSLDYWVDTKNYQPRRLNPNEE